MNMLSFLGQTPTIALRNAQAECGEDAIVISTKKISDKKTSDEDMYEVVVAIENKNSTISAPIPKVKTKVVLNTSNDNDIKSAKLYDFQHEILQMHTAIERIQRSLWEPKSHLFDLNIPPEFIDMYNLFEENEFDQEMTYTIMKKTISSLPVSLKNNPDKINNFFKLILRRLILTIHEVPLRTHQRKIMMLVGPTGVGKTTTIAKLASRYAYKMNKDYKVGIITLDSFRVGAIEQLNAYTNIMRLPLEVVKKPEELVEAILRLKDCNYIFIDTAGSSQYDIDKINLINEYQQKLNDITIEKALVLPANMKLSDLQEVYYNYARLDINHLIFSKLDETKSFGNLITFTHKVKKPISYLSIGQNVPDDLILSDQSFIIDCFTNKKCNKI